MAKKIMLGIAVAAATLIVTFAITGWPPVSNGVAGDITQAKRYQAQQLTTKDVVLEDTEAHRFIQSDTFDRLLKDEGARRFLNNPDVRVRLIDPQVLAAVGDVTLRSAIEDPALRKALNDPAVANALARPAFQAALASPGFRAALQDLHFAWAMARMRGGCDEFGCGGNSPIVDSAAIGPTDR
jgi:Flp pilus assembly protein TadD